jgi:hypothetical protein
MFPPQSRFERPIEPACIDAKAMALIRGLEGDAMHKTPGKQCILTHDGDKHRI